ncbi:uncharacterized protein AMSG_07591 [Thecamonas trahens ATCC 50062]|uniref:GRF-type domain-containing protein n=1 Tax=Thecamonas trahens ATCC 50062 TaxID=461836 RepID=A0A0L0DGZ4_THETB|nr:hypothetical protein AMSG_07591 [Thecamonas trahens ATCC 50062]KNC51406.1 hypothetical protein AMSG_07591 [Thecamonas trahens ATCC 50062]|eukprot:XP_013756073.1 hypothetical protein AMSG_07591 [Thecamonas trahens ATCC 50062]
MSAPIPILVVSLAPNAPVEALSKALAAAGVAPAAAVLLYSSADYESYAALRAYYRALLLALPSVPGKCIAVVATHYDAPEKALAAPAFHRAHRLAHWNVSLATGYNAELPLRFLLATRLALPHDTPLVLYSLGDKVFVSEDAIAAANASANDDNADGADGASSAAELAVRRKRHGYRAASLAARPRAAPTDPDVVICELPPCECGELPLLLRSAKSRPDHPNHGRPYWACANDDEWSCCGLFVWADLPLESQGDARDLVSSVCCRVHGLPTLRRRITRHTANHGRIFLVCSARQRCDFFQWADKPRFKFTRWRPPSLRTPYVRAPPIEPPRSAAAPGTTSAQVSGLDLLRAEREIHRLRLAGALTPDNASGLLATLDSPDALLTAAVVSVLNANADEAATLLPTTAASPHTVSTRQTTSPSSPRS